jgi:hypothetical protein
LAHAAAETGPTPSRELLPVLATGLFVAGYLFGSLRSRAAVRHWRAGSFVLGCVVLALAVSPPVHVLAERLFSIHMVEHELLMAVAAPLLVLGRPLPVLLAALPRPARRRVARWGAAPALGRMWLAATGPVCAWIVHTLALWAWHAPALFAAALHSEAVHAAQHLSFLGAALVYWSSLAANRHGASGYGAAVLSLFDLGAIRVARRVADGRHPALVRPLPVAGGPATGRTGDVGAGRDRIHRRRARLPVRMAAPVGGAHPALGAKPADITAAEHGGRDKSPLHRARTTY